MEVQNDMPFYYQTTVLDHWVAFTVKYDLKEYICTKF
jgi:hypothetical protein